MIDEKKLLNEIIERFNNYYNAVRIFSPEETAMAERVIEDIRKFIDGLPKNGEWIPVDERLPEEEDMMLVTCRTKSGRVSVNRAWCDEKGFWHGSGSMSGVIAWMPLPEPWEGE